ncbi:MAG: STT3 domain-containing protein [Candidatus Nanoarchaeia archaeon]|jgi:asparagine N-glycosylation enzyme membrane subunit Stt3
MTDYDLKEEPQSTSDSITKELQERKDAFLGRFKQKKDWIIYIIMVIIAWLGYYIRTLNLPLLQGKWLPDVDSYAFLRYAEYIAVHGKIMANDILRYYPFGFDPRGEFGILSNCIAYLQKILQIFNPNATTVNAAILYPVISFFIAAIFFFLFVKKMFNHKVAIISTAFLVVVPAFLYRTMAGVADKEALAVALMFAALYFYVSALKEEKPQKFIPFAALAGILSGLLAAVWGGYIFIMLALGVHTIICNLVGIFKRHQFYAYTIWMILLILFAHLFYPARFPFIAFTNSLTSQVMLIGFLVSLVWIILNVNKLSTFTKKVEAKMPLGFFALLITIGLGVGFLLLTEGHTVIENVFREVYEQITSPFATSRWQVTVAENHQPYFTDWIGQFSSGSSLEAFFGPLYMWLFFAGAILMFYVLISKIKTIQKKNIWILTGAFALFILLFSMSRYSASSTFNGETPISQIVYIGSLIVFFGILGYGYIKYIYKNKEANESVLNIDIMIPLMIIWFIIMIIAARSAIRLLFIFAPVTAVLAGYCAIELFERAKKLKKEAYKITAFILIALVVGLTFWGFYKNVSAQASYVGPSFNQQWQNAMSWAKDNTPEDAVFAHWWDYGYWVQWGANRATISDGGNAFGAINYFVGRHILTGQNETEALEFMKSKNVSYLLIISDEIGKYPAYSSIGADRNYDRYSWISTMVMQPDQIRETREEIVYLFAGGTPLDDDFIYQGKLFPANAAGVAGVFLPIQNIEVKDANGTKIAQKIMQPEAVIVYNAQQIKVPLKCVYLNGQEYIFPGKDMLEGCLRIIPTIESNGQANPLGAALYLSPEVYKGLFAKLYLLNQDWPYIKLAYSDENTGMPLALYQGRLIGPTKIWKVDYPEGLKIPPEYYKDELPDPEIDKIKR